MLAVAVYNHYKRLRNGDTSNGVELVKQHPADRADRFR